LNGHDDGHGREARLAAIAPGLAALIHGAARPDVRSLPESGAAVTLPVWLFTPDRAGTCGSKTEAPDGGRLEVPVRVVWDFPLPECTCTKKRCLCHLRDPDTRLPRRDRPVQVVPAGQTVHVTWRLAGLGLDHSGTLAITADPRAGAPAVTRWARFGRDGRWTETSRHAAEGHGVPLEMSAPAVPRHQLAQTMAGIDRDAARAKWGLVEALSAEVATAVKQAQKDLGRQIAAIRGEDVPRDVLDPTARQRIATDLTLPERGVRRATLWQALDAMAVPDRFRRADPWKVLAQAIWRDARTAVRRHLGDPKMGDRIRASVIARRPATLEELMAQVAQDCPSDYITPAVVARALTLGHDANAGTWDLDWFRQALAAGRDGSPGRSGPVGLPGGRGGR
jgi:hypothetical protein